MLQGEHGLCRAHRHSAQNSLTVNGHTKAPERNRLSQFRFTSNCCAADPGIMKSNLGTYTGAAVTSPYSRTATNATGVQRSPSSSDRYGAWRG